jgi:hypothetical protein
MSEQQPQQPQVDDNSDSDDGNPLATGTTLRRNITDAANDLGAALATTASNVASNVMPVAATATTPVAAATDAVAVSANVSLSEFNKREEIEMGLREFLTSTSLKSYVTDVDAAFKDDMGIALLLPDKDILGPVVSYCNPSIIGLSDFVPHYNLFLFHEGAELNVDQIRAMLQSILEQQQQQQQQEQLWRYELKYYLNRLSLQLRIGPVFNVPVFTVHIMHNVFRTSELPRALTLVESDPFRYNTKSIGPYTQLDLMLELLMHSDEEDPYAPVNVLVARGMNEVCVNFKPGSSEPKKAVPIQTVCDDMFNVFIASEEALSRVTKNALIAVMQNPAVKTKVKDMDMHFFDIFPSGQYSLYFNEVVRRCDIRDATGPIMIQESPLKRTGIIVAALTAVNAALREKGAHIVAGGGAAVSYYIQDFLKDAQINDAVIDESGVNMGSLVERCRKIPMNDIDCFVFGNVSRQFLLLFSLYMMILYENFYGRAKRYRMQDAVAEQEQHMQFVVPSLPDDPIELFMYGNRKADVNTQLISKRLAKNPNVQLVTQETKQFSQIVHPACNNENNKCNVDVHYMQPIDLVKKDIAEFVELYQISLYDPDHIPVPEDMADMILGQYMSDNMVSLKTTMLDIICIFCDEGKSLFIRIFMARKNPKDFARLRVFVDLYLLRLLQSNSSSEFIRYKDGLIADIGNLRVMMDVLNKKYYLEQGHIAAIAEGTHLDADRTKFLMLLRSIGRTIVAIPDPLSNVVPYDFRASTGAQTVQVFNNGPRMRYRFDLNAHMHALVTQHMEHMQPMQPMEQWLKKVFETIKFTPEMEGFFFSRLEKILDSADPDGTRKIAFNDMPVRSPGMLQLYNWLKGINMDIETLRQIKQLKVKDLRYNLLYPIRNFISNPKQRRIIPSAAHVINIYDKSTIKNYWGMFVKYVLLKEVLKDQPADSELMKIVSDPANYDDAVNEEIGRILLEWNRGSPRNLRGGSTRKRQRVCRWKNVVTRSKHGNRRRATKRSLRFKRTRRA